MAKSPLALALRKSIGDNDDVQKVDVWIDTGLPQLNKAVSGRYKGGVPSGRIIEISGPPSAGKTYIATRIMCAAQEKGGVAVFCDHENSFDVDLGVKNGLNVNEDDGNWVYKQPDTFEEAIDLTGELLHLIRENELIDPKAPIVIVYDSLASMVPKQKAEKFAKKAEGKGTDKDELNMNDNTALARCTSAHFPTLALWARKYNACLVFLNQIRTKIGVMFGDPTTTPGGNAPEFYCSVRIRLGASQLKDGKEKVGQDVGAECIKNKVAPPFAKCSWKFYYDTAVGIDVVESLVDHMIDSGKLEKNASGRVVIDGKAYTRAEVIKQFREEPFDELVALLGE